MAEPLSTLFPLAPEEAQPLARHSTGVVPSQGIRELIREKAIQSATTPIAEDQIQPASIDLRLAAIAYRVRARFLAPRAATRANGESNT